MKKPIITVFTPTYNRAHTLKRTYESLCNQTCKDFVWLIIDDGSVDNTRLIVEEWKKNDKDFEILYYYKDNGGMHTAHNLAYRVINTELNVCIDSDDKMPNDAIEKIISFWKKYGSDNVAGIVALDASFDGTVIGTKLPDRVKQTTTTKLYQLYGAKGDKKYIYRTSVINNVEPYPEYEGEKLVPLGYKYSQVDQKYEMLLMNEIVCLVEYQSNGSTNTIFKQYIQSPKGFAISNRLGMVNSISKKRLLKCTIHYIAECRIAGDNRCLKNSPRKILTVFMYPWGVLAQLYIYYKNWLMSL